MPWQLRHYLHCNIQYIDDLRQRRRAAQYHRASVIVTQTVPRSFLNSADEIVVVDALAEMCIASEGQMGAGSSSPEQKILSELALVNSNLLHHCWRRPMWWTKQPESQPASQRRVPQTFGAQERIMVCITPLPPTPRSR